VLRSSLREGGVESLGRFTLEQRLPLEQLPAAPPCSATAPGKSLTTLASVGGPARSQALLGERVRLGQGKVRAGPLSLLFLLFLLWARMPAGAVA
jgi:hypothetical protein